VRPVERPLWVTAKGTMDAIARHDPEVAREIFESEHAIALKGRSGAIGGLSWSSVAAFEADVAAGEIPDDVRVVMYDPERWKQTPEDEQRKPVAAMTRFGELAKRQGYTTIITPHPGLVSVEGSAFQRRDDESEEGAYVRSGLTQAAARAADVVETQAQRLQNDPHAYRRVVGTTAERAREANPDVWVLSGLATQPGHPATPEILIAAWESVRDVVDGHYISLSNMKRVEVMAAFLRLVLERT
jgi:hypothetical protein